MMANDDDDNQLLGKVMINIFKVFPFSPLESPDSNIVFFSLTDGGEKFGPLEIMTKTCFVSFNLMVPDKRK